MRALLVVVLCMCGAAAAVQVKKFDKKNFDSRKKEEASGSATALSDRMVGDKSFPLEAVKQLKELMDLGDSYSPHLSEMSVAVVCTNPLLPQIFRPVCQGKGADIVFSELAYIITHLDPCEICANPSCFGCLN